MMVVLNIAGSALKRRRTSYMQGGIGGYRIAGA
jgi:hypothetical protein